MALLDRLRRRLVPPPATPTPRAAIPVADISDPNKLTQGARGVLGELYTSTSALINAFTGMGTSRDPASYNEWAIPRTLNRGAHFGMGRNALINQALSKLPSTATREGWRVTITDDRVEDKEGCADQIAAYESRLGIQPAVARATTRGRQYSQGLVVLGIEDGREFNEPVDWQNVQTIRWAVVLDNRDFQPYEMYQADSRHFGKIKTFLITDLNGVLEDGLRYGPDAVAYQYSQLQAELDSKQGQLFIHSERVLHFPTVDYLSLLDTLQDSLGSYFTAMNGVATAAREASMVVYKITDWIRKAWSEDANLAHAHMSFVNKAKSTINAWMIDKDKEEVSIESRSLGGVADLPNPSMVWVSASLGTPVTEFWGVSPGGFGKGDAERETWHSQVRAYQRWLAPQLQHLHALILVAKDGCNLTRDIERTITFEDLSPPSEETRSQLRSEAISDASKAFESGGMTRDEYRATLASLSDDYFRFVRTTEGERVTADAPVGVFTGTLEILLAAARGEIPVESALALLPTLAPSSFTPESAAKITEPIAAKQRAVPATAGAATVGGGAAPSDEEDGEDEPSEVDLAWSQNPLPADGMEAKQIAAELKVPTVRVTRAHRAGLIEGWNVLGGKPRYSLGEVKRAVLEGNGKMAPKPAAAAEPATDANPRSLCVAVKLPPEFALWVPHKSEDPSPAHVTLLYVPDVDPSELDAVLAELHETFVEMMPFQVTHTGSAGYFDTPQGKSARVAYAETRLSVDPQALFDDLADGVAAFGLEPARHGEKYVPHTTLAYLSEPDAGYTGPVPEGSWQVIEAVAWYGNEEIDAFPLQGVAEEIDNTQVQDRATGSASERESKADAYWVWTTQRDGHVRPEHARLNGRRFREGVQHPTQGEPGTKPNCRCAKKVYVPPGSTRRAHEAATRAVRRALIRNFKRVSEPALKRAARERDEDTDVACDVFAESTWEADARDLSEEAKEKRIAEAFRKFHETVNMGAAELREWAKTEWSKKASVSRAPIERNLRLLETASEDWTLATAASALRTVNFVSRMKGAEQGEPVEIDGRKGPSKRDISLKNWAFDPGKDSAQGRDRTTLPDEETVKLWLAEHISDARKMPRDRMLLLKQLEDVYPYLKPDAGITKVYRGVRNVKRSQVGALTGMSDAVVDKSWTPDLAIAAKFATTDWTREQPDMDRVGAVLVADADPSQLLLNYELLADLPGVSDRYHDVWEETLRQAILDEKEVLALESLHVRTVKVVEMRELAEGQGQEYLVHDTGESDGD